MDWIRSFFTRQESEYPDLDALHSALVKAACREEHGASAALLLDAAEALETLARENMQLKRLMPRASRQNR